MSGQNDGGPAFPMQFHASPNSECQYGMTLRDWFAGQALIQMLRWEFAEGHEYLHLSEQAYMAADAMIAAREKGGA